MKLKELRAAANNPHAWVETEVHKVLDSGDKVALLKKDDAALIHLVQRAVKSHGSLPFAPSQVIAAFVKTWRKKAEKVAEAVAPMFKIQQRWGSVPWTDISTIPLSAEEAQEFLDDSSTAGEPDVEERAVSLDGKVVLRKKTKVQPKGKDVLSRDASPEVHRRNREFFKKHL